MDRQTPKYNSLRDYIKSDEQNKELFDIKEQFDEALWCAHLEELYNRKEVSGGRDKAFYEKRLSELRSLTDDSALISFLKYKGLPKFCDFDCDGTVRKDYLRQGYYSWFPREIYRILWNWKDLCRTGDVEFKCATIKQFAHSCYEHDMQMGPDTMNSFWITFSAYLISIYSDTYRWNNFKNTVFFKDGENGKQRNRADRIKEFIEEDGNYVRSEKIKEFAKLTHTVGNLVLVPAGYNGYRGTQPCIKDYLDLSLDNLLHVWDGKKYLGEDDRIRKQNYIRYINTFFLWDYVDDNYEPVPLCESHRKQMEAQRKTGRLEAKGVLPPIEEIDDLCSNINDRILRRSRFMIAILRIALGIDSDGKDVGSRYTYDGQYCDEWADWKVSGVYKKMMEEVFAKNVDDDMIGRENMYSGYGQVIEKIRDTVNDTEDKEFVQNIMDSAFRS